jgi:hypothetical protein
LIEGRGRFQPSAAKAAAAMVDALDMTAIRLFGLLIHVPASPIASP